MALLSSMYQRGVCGVYLILITVIGLPFASALALVLALIYFGERRPVVIAVVALVTPLLLWLFFTRVVLIPMPDPLIELGALLLDLAREA